MNLDQLTCTIIANAGESKSDAMEAIESARAGDFDKALAYLEQSDRSYLKAHEGHTKVLVEEANGQQLDMSFLLVHAASHLSAAQLTREFAGVIVDLYKEVKKNV